MSDPDPDSVTGWLVREGEVLASVEVAQGRRARVRGLLGRYGLTGALVLPSTRSVHSLGMRFDLDIAFVDSENVVIRTLQLKRNRVTLPVWRSEMVIEAEAGSFGQWELNIGDKVELRH